MIGQNAGMQSEPTRWSPGLIGFYASCAAVGLGAAVAAVVLIVFPGAEGTTPAAVIGILMVVVGSVTCLRSLKSARRE